ncbi:MAG TPA: hypothetical protein VKZ83_03680 [Phototrophicaceae bacterium]|nr:hypothetical protein [Phototrophicaceae bacterium]
MSTTAQARSTAQWPSSWRDEIAAEHEFAQARLRVVIDEDEPEEYL